MRGTPATMMMKGPRAFAGSATTMTRAPRVGAASARQYVRMGAIPAGAHSSSGADKPSAANQGGEPAGMGSDNSAAGRVCWPGGLLVGHEFPGCVIDDAGHARGSGIERGHDHEPPCSVAVVVSGVRDQELMPDN